MTADELAQVNAKARELGLDDKDKVVSHLVKPTEFWQLLSGMGDQYAQTAYRGLSDPDSLYGKVIKASNEIGVSTESSQNRTLRG